MILINVEKECDMLDDMYTLGEIGRRERDDIATYLLEVAKPVEAISVEWIENYLKNYRYMAPIEKNFVREMIKAWEEREEE